MYQSVFSVMDDFQSVWQSVPAFVSAVSNFGSKFELLKIRLTEQSSTTMGISAEKKEKINDLRERILVMQKALLLLGHDSGNIPLQERNRKSKSSLMELNISKLAVRCAELKNDLDSHGPALSQYGITQEDISEIMPLLVGIDELNNSTRKAILKRKGITESISDLEKALDKLLRFEMDSLIMVFKKNQPAFFKAFRNARVVIDYGHHDSGSPQERDDGMH